MAEKPNENRKPSGDSPQKVPKWEAEVAEIERFKTAMEAPKVSAPVEEVVTKEPGPLARLWTRLFYEKSGGAERGPSRFAGTLVSLHIDDTCLKLVVTKGKHVTRWAEMPLESGLVSGGTITNPVVVAEKIKSLLHDHRINNRKVIVGFSGLHCLSRVITLPILSGPVLSEAIRREAEREMPVSLDILYLAWQIVGRSDKEMKVFVIAYARNVADALMQTLQRAGIKPQVLDLAPLALTRVVSSKTALVTDVRPSQVDMVIMVDGVPELIRSLPLPEARPLAEKLPIIRQELERTIKFYDSGENKKPLESGLPIFVSGELANMTDFCQSLSHDLGYAVQLPLPPLKYPAQLSPSQYMVNIGLILKRLSLGEGPALSRINLDALPAVYRVKHLSVGRALAIFGTIVGAAILVGTAVLWQGAISRTEALQTELTAAQQLLTERQALQSTYTQSITGLEKSAADSTRTYGMLNGLLGRFETQQAIVNGDLPLVVKELPEDTTLASIRHSGSQVMLTGNAPGELQVSLYAKALESSKRYAEVVITSLTKTKAGGYGFTLTLKK